MSKGFRQSQAFLHTWSGLLLGWILFLVFVAGTIAFWREGLNRWMRPEIARVEQPMRVLAGSQAFLAKKAPDAKSWIISVATERSPGAQVFWVPQPKPGEERGRRGRRGRGDTQALIGADGQVAQARETRGGEFFYRFHFDLHYMPVIWARWLVGFATMMMLVAIMSGIVTHKKIFRDFFTLRRAKGQRSWLDGHNATAVLALPFHLMITYTGLVTLMAMLMPWAVVANYADQKTVFATLFPTAAAVERSRTPRLTYDGVTGRLVWRSPPPGAAAETAGAMIGLHAGRFAGDGGRWLYFLCGIAGTLMVASGLVLWTVKRRERLPDPSRPHFGFRLVERLNVAVIGGFPLGIACFFWANRLLPVTLGGRADWEMHVMFIAWAVAAVTAFVVRPARMWSALFATTGVLLVALPVYDIVATERGLFASLAIGDLMIAGIDATIVVLGVAFLLLARRVARHRPAAKHVRNPRAVTASKFLEPAE
ncbi:MAG: PepSY domain-containing protein [Sphingomonas sp.]|nr:MAG: PepSY domain-containing protein [Sphingomonas sp.]